MDERLKQQQRRQRLERTRRVGKAGLWQTAKDQTGLGEALPGNGSDPEGAYWEAVIQHRYRQICSGLPEMWKLVETGRGYVRNRTASKSQAYPPI